MSGAIEICVCSVSHFLNEFIEFVVLPDHGQSSTLSDKPLDKFHVTESLFFSCESMRVEGPRQHHVTIFSRSQLVLPLQLLHCCQSICEFFMITSTSDIVLLQVGRVLISDDKSAFCHCARSMSNTNLTRIRLFGASDALVGFPRHHLEHAKSSHCRGKGLPWTVQYASE
jgi:hypothetical protein